MITSGGLGTMGYGLPSALGAQLGAPGQIVIDIDGDASFCMTMFELPTIAEYDIPVKYGSGVAAAQCSRPPTRSEPIEMNLHESFPGNPEDELWKAGER